MFQHKYYQQIFAQHRLDSFDRLWHHAIDWFEPPNHKRGGWSGVGKLALISENSDGLNVFVKKQQNHGRTTLLHPVKGEPTFRREFKRLKFLAMHNIKVPKIVFYDEKQIEKNACAILATEELADFQPLDEVIRLWEDAGNMSRQQKRNLLSVIASSVRAFHETGLVHRALYPKHIFVKDAAGQPEIAFIDLEKSRFNPLLIYRAYFDLPTLNRRVAGLRRGERMYFFLQYFNAKKMTTFLKCIYRLIVRRELRR